VKRIEHYSFGRITVDGHEYQQDVVIYPERVQADWWRKEGHKLQLEDIPAVLGNPPEALVVGQGKPGKMQVDSHVVRELERLNVQLIVSPTRDACDTFNNLSEEGKHVVAALHLTC
jgi:hypothetical protein